MIFLNSRNVPLELIVHEDLHYTKNLTKKIITASLELILSNNSFHFNNINYIQILETAMGTKLAPTYTVLTLAYLEENLHEIIGKKYNNKKTEFIGWWMSISYFGNAHRATIMIFITYSKTYTLK